MRKITLTTKSLSAISKQPTIYVAASGGKKVIAGVRCRCVGRLKFGSKLIFDTASEGAEIFAVLDEGEENAVFGYSIPVGQSEIAVKIEQSSDKKPKISFSPVENDPIASKQSAIKKRIVMISCAIILCVVTVFGVLHFPMIPKDFETEEMRITLNREFSKEEQYDFYALYTAKDCSVSVTRDSFFEYPFLAETNLVDYCEMVKEEYNNTTSSVIEEDGLTYIVFEQTIDRVYKYHLYVYKSKNACWFVQFGCPIDKYDDRSESFTKWAKSIEFK